MNTTRCECGLGPLCRLSKYEGAAQPRRASHEKMVSAQNILRSWASTPDHRAYEGSTQPVEIDVGRHGCGCRYCGQGTKAGPLFARSQKSPACQRRAPRPCIPGLACASMIAGITLCRNDRSTVVAPKPQAHAASSPMSFCFSRPGGCPDKRRRPDQALHV